MNFSSPSFMLMEFTSDLPCTRFRPVSMISHFEESSMTGTLEMSGSLATRFRKSPIASWLSSIPSSMLMSMT